MKKHCLAVLLSLSLLCTACGSAAPQENKSESEVTESAVAESETQVQDDTEPEVETEAAPMVEVDEGLFNVELTISAEYMGEITQEELDASVKENGYKSATLNEDGSVTYVMSKKQHKELLQNIQQTIDESLQEMVGSADYPNVTKVEHNDDYTHFTITTKSEELDMAEGFSVLLFYLYGGMYAAFEGVEVEDIVVEYVNEASGEVIDTGHLADMATE